MLRRNARQRKEYLYRKSLEGKELELYEKKRKIRQALEGAPAGRCNRIRKSLGAYQAVLSASPSTHAYRNAHAPPPPPPPPTPLAPSPTRCAEGKPIPTELRREEADLRKVVELEDDNTAVPRTHVDDEYAHAGKAPTPLLCFSVEHSAGSAEACKPTGPLLPFGAQCSRAWCTALCCEK